jgi:hypothetical protein
LTRYVLTEDYDKTRYEVEVPLTSTVDYNQVRSELQIPEYVDPTSYLMERGIVTIWAALNPGRIRKLATGLEQLKIKDQPIPVLLFGGGAVKMLCPVANDRSSPLFRNIDDIDLIASRKRAQDLYKLLLAIGDACGTRYYHFVTRTDRRFNALRAGKRYRVRAIDKILGGDSLKPGTLDIFTDEIDLRHKVDVRAALDESAGAQLFQAREAAKEAKTTRECPECLSAVPLKATRCSFCTSPLPPVAPTPLPAAKA